MQLNTAVLDDCLDVQSIITREWPRHENVYAFSKRTPNRCSRISVPYAKQPPPFHGRVRACSTLVPWTVPRVTIDNVDHDLTPFPTLHMLLDARSNRKGFYQDFSGVTVIILRTWQTVKKMERRSAERRFQQETVLRLANEKQSLSHPTQRATLLRQEAESTTFCDTFHLLLFLSSTNSRECLRLLPRKN